MFDRQRISLWLILLFLLWGASAGNRPEAAAQGAPAYEIIQLVNQVRASYGLPPLEINNALMVAAQNHANWMAANNIYSHTGAAGSSPQSRASAAGYAGYATENIVGGTALTPRQGVIWWQNSAVHFATMTSSRYVHVGAGYALGHDQNFYALVVGTPGGSPPVGRAEAAAAPPPMMVAPIQLSPPREDGSIVHVVQPGHTLWAIAARYEVALSDLLWFNNLTEDSFLQPGDELIIRLAEGAAPPPTPTPPLTHVVRRGETAWTIAAWHKVSLADLLWLNNLHEDDFLHPGDEIVLRLAEGQAPPPTPTPQMSHIVKSGETAWGIALRYGLTLEQLLGFNGLQANAILRPGDELWIRPTFTPEPTATAEATFTTTPAPPATAAVVAAVSQVTATSTRTATRTPTPSPTPMPAPALNRAMGQTVFVGTLVAGLGLMALAGMVALVARREWR